MNRTLVFGTVVALAATAAAAHALTGSSPALVVSSPANIRGNWIINTNPRTDLAEAAVANGHLFVTHNWNPGSATGLFFNHPIGVTNADGFAIVAEDSAPMVPGLKYNTLFLREGASGTLFWRATAKSIQASWTLIDSALCNNNPRAILTVTPNVGTRGGVQSVTSPHNIGVFYTNGKWAIFNQDRAPMAVNAAYSVYVDTSRGATVVANASNIVTSYVYVSNVPALGGGNKNVRIIVTPNWSPVGGPNVYNNHAVGVWFDSARRQWAVYNEDLAPMPVGAAFNLEWDTSESTAG
jgi:hypothetical protein